MIFNDKQLFGEQRPWLDDNGDGLYSDGDGRIAAAIQLGKQGYNAAPPPTIHQVHPRIVSKQRACGEYSTKHKTQKEHGQT
jgi:hypothetical protein